MKNIIVLIGGARVSGAEKRLIETFSMLEDSGYSVEIIIQRKLYVEISKNRKDLLVCLGRYSQIRFVEDLFSKWPLVDKLAWIWVNFYLLKVLVWRDAPVLYFSLLNLNLFPVLRLYEKFFYEVTSPDIAKASFIRDAYSIHGKKLRLVSVSETVSNTLRSRFSDAIIYQLEYPFVKPVDSLVVPKKNLVVYAHRLVERKNPILAAHVFKRLAVEFPLWNFYICGDGPLASEVYDIVDSAHVDNFEYLGKISYLPRILSESKVFVSLITPDNYPSQSVFEAMGRGNALVLSDTGSSSMKLYDDNGVLVSIDFDVIYKSMHVLLSNDTVLEKYMVNSVELMRTRYAIERYISDTCSIIEAG